MKQGRRRPKNLLRFLGFFGWAPDCLEAPEIGFDVLDGLPMGSASVGGGPANDAGTQGVVVLRSVADGDTAGLSSDCADGGWVELSTGSEVSTSVWSPPVWMVAGRS